MKFGMKIRMNTVSPLQCPAWRKLAAHAARFSFSGKSRRTAEAPGVRLDYSRQHIDRKGLELLAQLAEERGFD